MLNFEELLRCLPGAAVAEVERELELRLFLHRSECNKNFDNGSSTEMTTSTVSKKALKREAKKEKKVAVKNAPNNTDSKQQQRKPTEEKSAPIQSENGKSLLLKERMDYASPSDAFLQNGGSEMFDHVHFHERTRNGFCKSTSRLWEERSSRAFLRNRTEFCISDTRRPSTSIWTG
uniref:Ashwin n=1 Tax=Globodera pallida TaxID=36090 RepID=A0A183C4E9_GLOPA